MSVFFLSVALIFPWTLHNSSTCVVFIMGEVRCCSLKDREYNRRDDKDSGISKEEEEKDVKKATKEREPK